MAFSKIILNDTTLMDATTATAEAEDITAPKTAMLADGVVTEGTGSGGGGGGLTNDQFVDHLYPQGSFQTSAVTVPQHTFRERTGITEFIGNNVTTVGQYAFNGCTALESIKIPSATSLSQTYLFYLCTSLKGIAFPSISGDIMGHSLEGCGALEYVDFGVNFGRLNASDALKNCQSLETVIIRKTTVSTLNNIANFNGTPFADGGTGGTLYVPEDLISAYQSATNWSTILGYANNQIKKIEGTIYETQYADGTPIS